MENNNGEKIIKINIEDFENQKVQDGSDNRGTHAKSFSV